MKKVIIVLDFLVSLLVFLVALLLVGYGGAKLFWAFSNILASGFHMPLTTDDKVMHGVAYTIVIVKAYSILVSYLQTHHLNIKYLIEIAIIAPTIEIIFSVHRRGIEFDILLGSFAFVNLVLYLLFYDRLLRIDNEEKEDKIQQFFMVFSKKNDSHSS